MSDINVKQLMKDIEIRVATKMNNPHFAKDVYDLGRLSLGQKLGDDDLSDIYSLSFLEKRLTIPRSRRRGFFPKIVNPILVKVYFVISKIMGPVLKSQEKFNRIVLKEIMKLRESSNVEVWNKINHVDFEDFFIKDETDRKFGFEEIKKYVSKKKSALEVSFGKGVFLEYLKSCGVDKIYGIEPNVKNTKFIADPDFIIEIGDYMSVLRQFVAGSLGAIAIIDSLESFPLGYLLGIFEESKRILEPGGHIIIRTINPESFNLGEQNTLHRRLLEDVLIYSGFEITETVPTKLDKNTARYVLVATKKG